MVDVASALAGEPGVEPVMFNPLRFGGNALRSAVAAALALPGRAMTAAGDLQRQGDVYDPAPAVDAAMMTMGGTAFGAPKGAVGAGPPIRAYHGSPHDFDRFDMSKIGTGEGAQAYGHGLYFAENPAVASSYKTAGPAASQQFDIINGKLTRLAREMDQYRGDQYGVYTHPKGYDLKAEYDALLEAKNKVGKTYEVNINAAPEQFLDWDKKVRNMPPEVQANLSKFGFNINGPDQGLLGSQIVNRGIDAGGGAASARAFSEAGIPGIRYLDQGSRGVNTAAIAQAEKTLSETNALIQKYPDRPGLVQRRDELQAQLDQYRPTSNYVLFRDNIIDILRKYQIAGIAPPAALLAAAQQGGGEQQ